MLLKDALNILVSAHYFISTTEQSEINLCPRTVEGCY